MFTRVLKHLGINGAYVPFMVKSDNLGQAVQSLRVLNIAGANVTVPYKEMIIPYLDILSEGANIIGSINTIVRNGDELKGYNTNAIGIMDALSNAGFDPEGKSALVFGTGGAARAAVFILNWLRTNSVFVTGRNDEKIHQLVNRIGGEVAPLNTLMDKPPAVELIVNATSVSSPEESPELASIVEKLKVPGCQLLLDLNYGRAHNFWYEMALRNHIRFMDGLSPLAYQARRTFALWTGLQVPPEEFVKALNGEMEQ
jgi:shikimate dehydrogenase